MAEEAQETPSGLEEKLKEAQGNNADHGTGEQGKEPKSQKPLDEIVEGLSKTAALGAGLASPLVFNIPNTPIYNPMMSLNAGLVAGPLALGSLIQDKLENKSLNFVKAGKEAVVGTALAPGLGWMFSNIEVGKQYVTGLGGPILGGVAAVGGLALGQAVFVGAYMGLNHIIQNHSFKGLGELYKKEFMQTVKRTWKYVLPLAAINVLFLAPYGLPVQLAYSSLMGLLFRIVGVKSENAKISNLTKALNPLPIIEGAVSVTGKLYSNSLKAVSEPIYAIGKTLDSYFSGAAPAPKAAPAENPA